MIGVSMWSDIHGRLTIGPALQHADTAPLQLARFGQPHWA